MARTLVFLLLSTCLPGAWCAASSANLAVEAASPASTKTAPPACLPYVNMWGADLDGMPLSLSSSQACQAACQGHPRCILFTFVGLQSPRCSAADGGVKGCCWLKTAEVGGKAPIVWDAHACSAFVRVPPNDGKDEVEATAAIDPPLHPKPSASFPSRTPSPTRGRASEPPKNVLYIVVDDLRPDLEAYGQNFTHNPNIAKLASTGLVFDNAYCQIAVCSPSRLSFLTGRRPDHAGMYNFINHIRQADCGISEANTVFTAPDVVPPVNLAHADGGCEANGQLAPCGGSGQCCSLCTQLANCTHWSFIAPVCHLKGAVGGRSSSPGAVSAARGTLSSHANWTSNPGHFRHNGYLTLHTGKLFHTEEGGTGNNNPDLNGPGMPPNSDPRSWSPGLFMPQVNAVARMFGIGPKEQNGVPASLDGIMDTTDPSQMEKANQLADRVISSDAVVKLRLAAFNLAQTGQPFFLAAGFRKPHLPFRFPAPWLKTLQPQGEIAVAAHPTLDRSVPPIAHGDFAPQGSPFVAVANTTAQNWRLHYYASIAWVDSQIGRVLDELDSLGLTNSTLVVFHSDHGWSLGEHGEWQKFSNFEHGTRVPLIIRAPWLPSSVGKRTSVLAELIDVGPTMWGLMGLKPPANEAIDGKDLSPVVAAPGDAALAASTKPYAMSQYFRCPEDTKNASNFWKHNSCLFVDRVLASFFGYTIRTPEWRYTEWTRWNGTALAPDHTPKGFIGHELYPHRQVGIDYSFDEFENTNQAEANPQVVARLRAMLHEAIANQTRIKSLGGTA